jgi:hypothetical protein
MDLFQNFSHSTRINILSSVLVIFYATAGLIIVALGITIDDLAENVGYTSTQIETVFLARCGGTLIALYMRYAGPQELFEGNSHLLILLLGII